MASRGTRSAALEAVGVNVVESVGGRAMARVSGDVLGRREGKEENFLLKS
jgi:hypothetical protein